MIAISPLMFSVDFVKEYRYTSNLFQYYFCVISGTHPFIHAVTSEGFGLKVIAFIIAAGIRYLMWVASWVINSKSLNYFKKFW